MAGESAGRESIAPNDMPPMTDRSQAASDQDALARRWPQLNDDDWAHLPIVRPGDTLEQGETYFDLNNPDQGSIQGSGSVEATEQNRYVAKGKLDPAIWSIFVSGQQSSSEQDDITRPIDDLRRGAEQAEAGDQQVSDLSRRLENEYPANEQPGGGQQQG
jgi:hypothetical protein